MPRFMQLTCSARIPHREEASMAEKNGEVWTQRATRIPKELHRRLNLHCVESDTASFLGGPVPTPTVHAPGIVIRSPR